MNPQETVAHEFMARRGYDIEPFDVERVEGDFCWYFYYSLPEGRLELEVVWAKDSGWSASVTDFNKAND
jgi:hypothetical protein